MDNNPFSEPSSGTLDENVIRPGEVMPRFGWRWALSCFYQFILAAGVSLCLKEASVEEALFTREFGYLLIDPAFFPGVLLFLAAVLLLLRTQVGWVMSTSVVSGMIVLSTIGFVVQFIPTIEPVTDGRWARLTTATVSAGFACFVFYLLSHPRLRAGFRIPQSWIRRCVTLGGLLGTGVGMWMIWLATRGVDPGIY